MIGFLLSHICQLGGDNMDEKDKYAPQKKYISKLKQIPLKIPHEEYEQFKDVCSKNGSKPVTEIR